MNFDYILELHWRFGYLYALVLIALVSWVNNLPELSPSGGICHLEARVVFRLAHDYPDTSGRTGCLQPDCQRAVYGKQARKPLLSSEG
jgi:hypothetical protein